MEDFCDNSEAPGINYFSNPFAVLKNLKQGHTVRRYYEEFKQFIGKVHMPELLAVIWFIAGLKDDIRKNVKIFNPDSLHGAYCLAKLQEATIGYLQRKAEIANDNLENPSILAEPKPQKYPCPSIVCENLTKFEAKFEGVDLDLENSQRRVMELNAPKVFDELPKPKVIEQSNLKVGATLDLHMYDNLTLHVANSLLEEEPIIGAHKVFDEMPQPQLAVVLLDGDKYKLQQGSQIAKFVTSCLKVAFEVLDSEVHKEVMTEVDSQLDSWLHDDSKAFNHVPLVLEIPHQTIIHELNASIKIGQQIVGLKDLIDYREIQSWMGTLGVDIGDSFNKLFQVFVGYGN